MDLGKRVPAPRRGGRRLPLAGLLLLLAFSSFAAGPLVRGLKWRFENNRVVVSFAVADALEREDVRQAILSTTPVTFTFQAEIAKGRTLWRDRVVASRKVLHTVQYDNLTRQFTVTTAEEGVPTDQRVLASWEEMADYMGEVRDLALASVADLKPSEGGYTLRVKVRVYSDFVLWIIPSSVETPWVSTNLPTP
ncbi:MAG: DUF4390 domain-containing protein [Acidobacteriota bacterium]